MHLSEQDTAIFVETSFFECTDDLPIFLCAQGHVQAAQLIGCPENHADMNCGFAERDSMCYALITLKFIFTRNIFIIFFKKGQPVRQLFFYFS